MSTLMPTTTGAAVTEPASRTRGRPSRAARIVALVSLALATAACGGDDDDTGPTTQAPAATSAETDDTVEETPATTEPTTTFGAPATTAAPGGEFVCPSHEAISEAAGEPMVFDDNAPVSAPGFCPYKQTGGAEDLSVTVTYTRLDVTSEPDPGAEAIPDLGERAFFSDSSDELLVWTGDTGIIVGVLAFGTEYPDDAERTIAVATGKAAVEAL